MNNNQIKLVQMAVKKAGIRKPKDDRRYRMLLGNYKQPNGARVTSCKQLNSFQMEDLLAICESMGWRLPGASETHFRDKVQKTHRPGLASFAQQSAIEKLGGDMGWNVNQINGLIEKVTTGKADSIVSLTSSLAYKVIEAMKAMFSRKTGKNYKNLREIQDDMEVDTDGKEKEQTSKVG